MKVLLDSHVVVWWLAGGGLLSRKVQATLAEARTLLISPVSLWEITMLHARGRLTLDREPHAWAHDLLAVDRVGVAPLVPAAAIGAALLDGSRFPGDAADRMIYAAAADLGVPLLTKDKGLRAYARRARDLETIW